MYVCMFMYMLGCGGVTCTHMRLMPGIILGLDLTDLTGVAGQKLTAVTLAPFLQPCSPTSSPLGVSTRAHHRRA